MADAELVGVAGSAQGQRWRLGEGKNEHRNAALAGFTRTAPDLPRVVKGLEAFWKLPEIARLVNMAAIVAAIRHHHERFAGGGYPDGIAGDAIPRAARILAVADTYDAITSNRPYRAGAPAEVAYKVLREVSGKQLDPAAVNAFLATREPGRVRGPSSGVGRFRLGRLLDGA